MSKVYIGIDNGVSGTIAVVGDDVETIFMHTPTKVEQNYTKAKQSIRRVDADGFLEVLKKYNPKDVVAIMERPLVNPSRFTSTLSAIRCFEAELVLLESLQIKHLFIDSKEWQRKLLPKGIKGSEELKKASLDIGNRLFPQFEDVKHGDRDSLLMAEWARRNNL